MISQWYWQLRKIRFHQLIKQGVDPEEAERLAMEHMKKFIKKVVGDEEE